MNAPKDRNVLFWSVEQRDFAFRHLEMIPSLKYNTMKRGRASTSSPRRGLGAEGRFGCGL